ncbi:MULTISPECIES: hypothetical protein [unclassified Streptomyces]|uniref:hypothetical protein n=2 Tax=Streptomyces TaxID=1883 RepID=UPI0027B94631|nr:MULTISPECIES: hypothetical protein [unclassified Streptomyces]
MPSKSAFYRLIEAMSEGTHAFGEATSRRSAARRPRGAFTPSSACRPGEMVQIDTTPLDVLVVLEDGVSGRPELTIAVDVATRTICAAVLRPAGTKALDAALLLAKMLVPELLRPGWSDALAMSATLIPHRRLLEIDACLEQAAAKPVIVPETIGIDHGKVFVSSTFLVACRSLGVLRPAVPPGDPDGQGNRRADVFLDQHAVLPAHLWLHRFEHDPPGGRGRGRLDARGSGRPVAGMDCGLLAAAAARRTAQPVPNGPADVSQ